MIFLWISLGLLAWLVLPLPIALVVARFMSGEAPALTSHESGATASHLESARVA